MTKHRIEGQRIAEFTAHFVEIMAEQRRIIEFEDGQEIIDRVVDSALLLSSRYRKWNLDSVGMEFSELLVLLFLVWDFVMPDLNQRIKELVAKERKHV